MNRRSFLRLFSAAAPVAVVAPKYFFAPIGGWLGALRGRRYDLLKMDDLVDKLSGQYPNLIPSYYEKSFIATLKMQTVFLAQYPAVLPSHSGEEIQFFRYTAPETHAQAIIL